MDPPGNRAEMSSILVHKTWQTNILWQMDPPWVISRQTYFGQEWQLADLLENLTPKCIMGYILWDYLAAILDSSRKGGNFLLCLNN